ncbi:hypothetical protein KPL78_01140 [Roseomonas sp. HJA6]|uniref:Uncharacterized protein n=1 Tax=Roseomonas alba TaxID=2846776 RepID=A0ABS7A284_9PROT|nr:hypothetical protein [Neoroseomonas alba]MBW6396426.1 hypothetical protein [Neoroseomonas alba]
MRGLGTVRQGHDVSGTSGTALVLPCLLPANPVIGVVRSTTPLVRATGRVREVSPCVDAVGDVDRMVPAGKVAPDDAGRYF